MKMENLKYWLDILDCNMENLNTIEKNIKDNREEVRKHYDNRNFDICKEINRNNDVLYGYKYDQELKLKLIKHNVQVAFYKDCIDYVVQIVNEFAGKKIGPKTTEKIKARFKELTGNCSMYISRKYSKDYIGVNLLNPEGYNDWRVDKIELTFNGGKMFDDNGKLLPAEKMSAELWGVKEELIEDVDTEVKVLKELYKKVLEASQVLKQACEQYNEHIVEKMETVYGKSFPAYIQ